ncbi:MAG: ABC-type branched-subunit amino acid transport system substrate-binding protein [Gammaproteobacteria bacterium]
MQQVNKLAVWSDLQANRQTSNEIKENRKSSTMAKTIYRELKRFASKLSMLMFAFALQPLTPVAAKDAVPLAIASASLDSTTWHQPIYIGLDADLSKGAAQSGEAIRRGIVIAIEKINAGGDVLRRPLELMLRDRRGIPARGVDNIEAFAKQQDLSPWWAGFTHPSPWRSCPRFTNTA